MIVLASLPLVLPLIHTPSPHTQRLDNGLRAVVVEEHALPLISVQVWFHAGSADDPPGRNGLCRVTTLWLKTACKLEERLGPLGVACATRTETEASCVALTAPREYADCLLQAMTSVLSPPPLSSETWQAVAQVAAETDVQRNPLREHLFAGHPYGHDPHDVSPELWQLPEKQARAFHERLFVPANATLVVVGDVSPNEVLSRIDKVYAGLPSPPRPLRSVPAPTDKLPRLAMRLKGHALEIGWRLPPMGLSDADALEVMLQWLADPVGGPMSDRLGGVRELRLQWDFETWESAGMLRVVFTQRSTFDPSSAVRAAGFLDSGFSRMAQGRISPITIHGARARARLSALRRHEAFHERALAYGRYATLAGFPDAADPGGERFAEVTLADIRALSDELRIPLEDFIKAPIPSENFLQSDAPLQTIRPPHRELRAGNSAAGDHPAQPEVCHTVPLEPRRMGTLLRGTPIPGVEWIQCVLPGLPLAEVRTLVTRNDGGKLELPAGLLKSNSPRHTARQLQEYLAYHGLELDLRPGPGPTVGLVGRGPGRFGPQLIELQAEWLGPPLSRLPFPVTIHILVVGDVEPEDITSAVNLVWCYQRLAGTTSPPSDTRPSAPAGRIPEEAGCFPMDPEQRLALDRAATIADRLEPILIRNCGGD